MRARRRNTCTMRGASRVGERESKVEDTKGEDGGWGDRRGWRGQTVLGSEDVVEEKRRSTQGPDRCGDTGRQSTRINSRSSDRTKFSPASLCSIIDTKSLFSRLPLYLLFPPSRSRHVICAPSPSCGPSTSVVLRDTLFYSQCIPVRSRQAP